MRIIVFWGHGEYDEPMYGLSDFVSDQLYGPFFGDIKSVLSFTRSIAEQNLKWPEILKGAERFDGPDTATDEDVELFKMGFPEEVRKLMTR